MTTGQPGDTREQAGHEPVINRYFKAAIKTRANDLHLKVGQPARLRLQGTLKSTTGEILTAQQMEEMVFEILSPDQKERFLRHGTVDFAYEYDPESRFRVNVFRQRGHVSLVGRRVNSTVPTFEALCLPSILGKIAESSEGLVLVVGPTGCGKTTTIAAMLDFIAHTRACHIVTIEDPIEYLYKDNKAIVSQREIGLDVPNYEEALTYLMRQDPDVVLVGEMRDAQTVTAGMRAAETGHLVFGTLHSTNASQAIHRLLDLFPPTERELVRQSLALSIKAVISQVLIPSIKEGTDRVPAVEILLANSTVKKLIAEGREADLPSVIRACQREGMQDLTDNICELVKNGTIDPKEAYRFAPNQDELKMALKGIRTVVEGIL
jgi:twitching motility protein PilT